MARHHISAIWFALAVPALITIGGPPAARSTVARQMYKPEPKKPKESLQQGVHPLELKEVEAVRFPSPALTAASATDLCDSEGNIYLVYGTVPPRPAPAVNPVPNLGGMPVTRLTLDSHSLAEFPTPSLSGYQSLRRIAFSVDHWGDVYEMLSAEVSQTGEGKPGSGKFLIVKFNHDGSVDSSAELDHNLPHGLLWPIHFGPFANGNLLVMGEIQVAGYGSKPFTGVFDSRGDFLQEVKLSNPVTPKPRATAPQGAPGKRAARSAAGPHHGMKPKGNNPPPTPSDTNWVSVTDLATIVPGPEDTVYLLQPSDPAMLYTVSSDGQVLSEAHIRYPAPNLRAVDASPTGRSSVLVEFFGTKPDGMGGFRGYFIFALVDPRTGKTTAVYRLPKNAGGFFACAAGLDDFEFIRSSKKRKLEVVKFSGE